MDERIEHIIDIYTSNIMEDINDNIDNLELMNDSLFRLTQALYDKKIKIKYYQRELEGKLFRYGLANQSLTNLIKGNKFKLIKYDVNIADLFSIASITRMQIESFMIIFYLFFDDINDDEKNLRYDIYKVHGLQKQLGFQLTKDSQEFNKTHILKIKKEFEQASQNIINSDIYQNANSKTQNNLLNPKYARLLKTDELFKKSGLEDSRINLMWQVYSNYAHGEHISDRQYNTIYKIEKSTQKISNLILTINMILTAKLITFYMLCFSDIQNEYNGLDLKNRVLIELWNNLKIKN